MKLTKYAHSCVLAEDAGSTILFDPGIFSWQSGTFDVGALQKLDAVVVTHKHPDHLGEPFVRALVAAFPDTVWITPADAHDDLKSFGVQNVTDKDISAIGLTVRVGEHALVEPFGIQVQNLQADWNGKLTAPGDSHDITTSNDVLFLPVQAPWGTTIRAIQLALKLKPKFVLPVHDWMWNEEWRQRSYDRFENIFSDSGTTFLRPVDGQPIEVDA